jgi:hypothetical protein
MPILAVDENGRIYQTSRDRSDGLGYGEDIECVTQGDVTLGASYLKAQAARTQNLVQSKTGWEAVDAQDRLKAQMGRMQRAAGAVWDRAQALAMENPNYRAAMTRKAALAGCKCNFATPMSGYGLSANGQQGWAGMDRTQQTLHYLANGIGHSRAFGVDPQEAAQTAHREQAMRLLRLKAK